MSDGRLRIPPLGPRSVLIYCNGTSRIRHMEAFIGRDGLALCSCCGRRVKVTW